MRAAEVLRGEEEGGRRRTLSVIDAANRSRSLSAAKKTLIPARPFCKAETESEVLALLAPGTAAFPFAWVAAEVAIVLHGFHALVLQHHWAVSGRQGSASSFLSPAAPHGCVGSSY
eukprot:COSAG04_NODE_2300_length_4366_cov_4.363956_2_plen_116_part_00